MLFVVLLLGWAGCFILNISLGSVSIPFKQVITTLFGGIPEKESWHYIVENYRLPKAITATLVGSGLGLSGLLMQTLFRNPLAGPFVLGISSGASLGVALLLMGGSLLGGVVDSWAFSSWGITLAASLGSFLVLLAVMVVSVQIRDTMAILIIGLMFGSVTAAVVGILAYFSSSEQLQQYVFWSFGSLGDLNWKEVGLFTSVTLFGTLLGMFVIKALNALLLGEHYAASMGVRIKQNRLFIILITSLLAGSATAYAGPIAFVGLAVPHLTRLLFDTSDHRVLFPTVLLSGAALMLLCDTVAQLPGSELTLPINAVTSIVGAPIVIWLLVRKRKMVF